MTDGIQTQVGLGLRRARLSRGWSLRRAAVASKGRFAPTSIAGYERGERAISLARFVELCRLYGAAPTRVLAAAEQAASGREPTIVDVDGLGPPRRHRAIAADFVAEVVARRRSGGSKRVAIRAEDVEVLASVTGVTVESLAAHLTPAADERRGGRDPQMPFR